MWPCQGFSIKNSSKTLIISRACFEKLNEVHSFSRRQLTNYHKWNKTLGKLHINSDFKLYCLVTWKVGERPENQGIQNGLTFKMESEFVTHI